jgi:hypothetical protein
MYLTGTLMPPMKCNHFAARPTLPLLLPFRHLAELEKQLLQKKNQRVEGSEILYRLEPILPSGTSSTLGTTFTTSRL